MIFDEFVELELNIDNAKYLIYTDYIKEYDEYFDDDIDYFTYEDYAEECELDEDEWIDDIENADEEEDWCLNFYYNNPDIRTITIPTCCLDDNSTELINIQCDNCGKIFQEEYRIHLESYYDGYDDLCSECKTELL